MQAILRSGKKSQLFVDITAKIFYWHVFPVGMKNAGLFIILLKVWTIIKEKSCYAGVESFPVNSAEKSPLISTRYCNYEEKRIGKFSKSGEAKS